MGTTQLTGERADILQSLGQMRFFLRNTARGMSEAQVRERSTASELTLGGLIKHVAATERSWQRFITEGPAAMAPPEDFTEWQDNFRLTEGETLEQVLERYAEVAAETDRLVGTTDLDHATPLPEAPWFEPGATWTARRVFLHIAAETAQHAGHADIIRESIDGAKSMG